MDRIPPSGIRNTKKLDIQTDPDEGFIHRQIDDPGGRLPGCPAGCPSNDVDANDCGVVYFNGKNRFAEFFTILTQTILPGKGASGGRGMDSSGLYLLAGGNHGDALFAA